MAILSKELCDKFSDCVFDITGQRPDFSQGVFGTRIEINYDKHLMLKNVYEIIKDDSCKYGKIDERPNGTGLVIMDLTENILWNIITLFKLYARTSE